MEPVEKQYFNLLDDFSDFCKNLTEKINIHVVLFKIIKFAAC